MIEENTVCISLSKNKAEWPEITKRISDAGFPNVTIFPAVNGYELSHKEKLEIVTPWNFYYLENKLPRKYHSQLTTWGAVGCYLSHATLGDKLVKSDKEGMTIFEDDVKFKGSPKVVTPPKTFDMFFLDVLWEENPTTPRKGDFRPITSLFFGMHAYIIHRDCAAKLLAIAFPIEIQIDSFIHVAQQRFGLELYASNLEICTQREHESSIQTLCTMCYPYIGHNKVFAVVAVVLFLLVIGLIVIYNKLNK